MQCFIVRATLHPVADVGALRELHAFMREVGATYARAGELELRLEPLPPRVVVSDPSPSTEPDDEERRSLEALLYSTGVDPSVFADAAKRLRAA